MIKKRIGVFETNSSSVHSICIQKKPAKNIKGMNLYFGFGEYGWGFDSVDPASYLRTAMYELDREDDFNKIVDKLTNEYGVDCILGEDARDEWYPHGYVDHCGELTEFIDELMENDDLLIRFLLGEDSVIYTGNDNVGEDIPYESEETHEVFWKGN